MDEQMKKFEMAQQQLAVGAPTVGPDGKPLGGGDPAQSQQSDPSPTG
jgi:hypothetical protein